MRDLLVLELCLKCHGPVVSIISSIVEWTGYDSLLIYTLILLHWPHYGIVWCHLSIHLYVYLCVFINTIYMQACTDTYINKKYLFVDVAFSGLLWMLLFCSSNIPMEQGSVCMLKYWWKQYPRIIQIQMEHCHNSWVFVFRLAHKLLKIFVWTWRVWCSMNEYIDMISQTRSCVWTLGVIGLHEYPRAPYACIDTQASFSCL